MKIKRASSSCSESPSAYPSTDWPANMKPCSHHIQSDTCWRSSSLRKSEIKQDGRTTKDRQDSSKSDAVFMIMLSPYPQNTHTHTRTHVDCCGTDIKATSVLAGLRQSLTVQLSCSHLWIRCVELCRLGSLELLA